MKALLDTARVISAALMSRIQRSSTRRMRSLKSRRVRSAVQICTSSMASYRQWRGDVLGHETMGEVVEVARGVSKLKIGDRVVVPFTIAYGECFFCKRGFFSGCERSIPAKDKAEKLWGHSPAGLFGYSHVLGGYAGGQAEYLRVPYADVGPIKIESDLSDEQVLFVSESFPRATWRPSSAISNLATRSRYGLWTGRPIRHPQCVSARRGAVLAIETIPERLRLAEAAGALTIDFHAHDVFDRIQEPTEKRGADACIDAMGTEPDTASSVGQCTTTAVVTGASTGIGYQLACIAAGHVAPVACVPELRPALWPHHRRCRGDFDFATVAPQTLSVLIPVSDDSQPS